MKITVYSNPNCIQCDNTKRFLVLNKIDFESKMLANSPEIFPLIKEKEYRTAPIVVAGEDSWSGFQLDKLKELLGE